MTAEHRALRRRSRARAIGRAFSGQRGGRRRSRVLVVLAAATLTLFVLGLGVAGGAGLYAKQRYDEISAGVVPPEQLIAELPRGGARIYDRNGALLYEFVDDLAGLRRPVPLAEISPWVIAATISTEDQSFETNNGLNTRGLVRAAVENLSPSVGGNFFEGSGGSSITQQLAKNVYIPREERAERSVERKLKETVIALELTQRYTKDQILEWYLNSIPYGGIYTGIQAAAEGYFGKDAKDLTLAEAAVLAGIPQSPAAYAPLQGQLTPGALVALTPGSPTKVRQLEVLRLMVENGAISQAEADTAARERVEFRPNRFDIEAAHFVLGRVATEIRKRFGDDALFRNGLEVTTSLDIELQHEAERILDEKITEFGEQADLFNGAAIVLDPLTGEILTYVGSRDYFRDDIFGRNDNVIGLNSPGSTLKPFTFMTAFTEGWGTGTGILDTPLSLIDFATGQTYTPRDPIVGFLGPITAASALGNSLNITAVKAIQFAGVERTVQMLKQVGYTTLNNPLGYGPSLTVGGVDITLQDQAIAYSVLANNGLMRGQEIVTHDLTPGDRTLEPVALLKVVDADGTTLYRFDQPIERRVVPAEFPYLVTSILSDGRNQCITYGVCFALSLPDGRPSAAKTGTSEPFEESRSIGETWTMGYTPNLVAGVWSGNSDNSPITGITSTTVSLRTWKELMAAALERLQLPRTSFTRPPGIVEREVCWPSGRLPTEHCPDLKRYSSLFAASVIPRDPESSPELYDSWWKPVRIDTRTGLIAPANAPATFVREEVRLVFPKNEVVGWDSMMDWAEKAGVASQIAPIEAPPGTGPLVQITSPAASATVQGRVIVTGRAMSDDFLSYAIEWGNGLEPTQWVRVYASGRGVLGGSLGVWDTSVVPDGPYTLRVVLEDSERGIAYYQLPLTVSNGAGSPPVGEQPYISLTGPVNDQTVSGIVAVAGTAAANDLLETTVEVGAGLAPSEWQLIGRTTSQVVSSVIARWDTSQVPDGIYTLRVVVTDRSLGSTQVNVTVSVRNQ